MSGPARAIGIIAGSGTLPFEVARSVATRGGSVHVVMVDGAADSALAAFPHTLVNWAQPGRAIAAFKRAGISDIVLLGAFPRPSFRTARPDLVFFRVLPAVTRLLKAGGDDAVLRGVVAQFKDFGFNIVGVGDVAGELLVGEGVLTARVPQMEDRADIETGFALIAALGRFDIGQAAVVTNGQIEAIEGAEGTDRMLERVAASRSGRSAGERRGVLVKLPKPGQDLRVDLPTIGPNTVGKAAEAVLSGIAVMAGQVLAAERAQMIEIADRNGLFITGVGRGANVTAAPAGSENRIVPVQLGVARLDADAKSDISRGAGILSAAFSFGAGSAAVSVGGRVMAVGAGESAIDVVERARALRGRGGRKGVVVVGAGQPLDAAIIRAVGACRLKGVAALGGAEPSKDAVRLANELGVFIASADDVPVDESGKATPQGPPLKLFLVAGEHSGDALGGKLIAALEALYPGRIMFSGVGGEEMARQGFRSIFPIEDVAVMGPLSILPRLPRIVRRVHQSVDAALAFRPDAVVIIDSPEFTHPIAKRIRKRAPDIPIIDYVSPSVWAWRPGRAKKMRPYVDRVLALLPFEPEAHERLGGPPCAYVGHPLIEKLDEIEGADGAALADRLGLAPDVPVLLVLPGSRSSEVGRLIDVFGETVAMLRAAGTKIEVVIPAVRHLREMIEARTAGWAVRPHIVDGEDKYAAMRLARAALAASGTVTLELALAQTPSVVAYKVDKVMERLRFLLKVPSIVLANLVLGKNVYPEFLQEMCTADNLSAALRPLLEDTEARRAQLEGLAQTPEKLKLSASSPSLAAAETVLAEIADHAGKSRRAGPM